MKIVRFKTLTTLDILNAVNIRMINHAQMGSIQEHIKNKHQQNVSKNELLDKTKILFKTQNVYELKTYEALSILTYKHDLNKQNYKTSKVCMNLLFIHRVRA